MPCCKDIRKAKSGTEGLFSAEADGLHPHAPPSLQILMLLRLRESQLGRFPDTQV